MYKYLKKLIFCLPSEAAHQLGLTFLKYAPDYWFPVVPEIPVNIFGLTFKNPIGLAAGCDKNGDYIDVLGKLGFGFIEVGTITPKPQSGNPKPRLFRLKKKHALINRMGFNNKGVDYLVERLKERKFGGIVGINIGKNSATPLEEAVEDYIICLKKVYPYADYITINISSPNTPGLRQLQQSEYLNRLLLAVSDIRALLEKEQGIYRPLLLKISPDETGETLEAIVNAVKHYKIDGIIATNTTLNKTSIQHLPQANEKGGLSGAPLLERSNQVLQALKNLLNHFPQSSSSHPVALIGVGGIFNVTDVEAKLAAGANLVQVYTGLVYHGPFWIKHLLDEMKKYSN